MSITPTLVKFTSGGEDIPAELFTPVKANGGTIIIAHGSDGLENTANGPWKTMIEEYASDLALRGFVVLVPKYFEATHTKPPTTLPEIVQMIGLHGDEWLATLTDAMTAFKGVDPSRIGLLGFSLGGYLCLGLR